MPMRPPLNRIVIEFDWPTFVTTLRELFIACSQEKLARELDVSAKTVSNWERDVAKPQWRNRTKLFRLGWRYQYRRQYWPSRSFVAQWSDD